MTVAVIADHLNLSQRTFHRYFPTKAQSVGPMFDWMTSTFDSVLEAADPDEPIVESLRRSYAAMIAGDRLDRSRALFPLIFADGDMWAVFLRKVHDGERALAPVLAPLLGLEANSLRARAAAAAVATATRLSLEGMVTHSADPEGLFLEVLTEHASPLLPG